MYSSQFYYTNLSIKRFSASSKSKISHVRNELQSIKEKRTMTKYPYDQDQCTSVFSFTKQNSYCNLPFNV